MADTDPPIVFFDGVCGLCNWAVDFLMKRDTRRVLRFATLQGQIAEQKLGKLPEGPPDSVIVWHQGKRFDRSDAALLLASLLGGGWKVFLAFKLLPRGLRDTLYEFVARNRYKWFGIKESCRMPTKEERAQFLG